MRGHRRVTAAMLWLTKRTVRPWCGDFAHFAEAFLLEGGVADGEDFVDEEDFGFEVGGDGEGQADVHAGGVALDGRVDEFLDFGEGDDLVELAGDFALAHAEDGAVEEDVFAAGELGMEAGADFEQAADAAVNVGVADGGLGDARKNLEQRGFAGAVAADEAEDFAFLHFEGNVLERPERFVRPAAQQAQRVAQGAAELLRQQPVGLVMPHAKPLADPLDANDSGGQRNTPQQPNRVFVFPRVRLSGTTSVHELPPGRAVGHSRILPEVDGIDNYSNGMVGYCSGSMMPLRKR